MARPVAKKWPPVGAPAAAPSPSQATSTTTWPPAAAPAANTDEDGRKAAEEKAAAEKAAADKAAADKAAEEKAAAEKAAAEKAAADKEAEEKAAADKALEDKAQAEKAAADKAAAGKAAEEKAAADSAVAENADVGRAVAEPSGRTAAAEEAAAETADAAEGTASATAAASPPVRTTEPTGGDDPPSTATIAAANADGAGTDNQADERPSVFAGKDKPKRRVSRRAWPPPAAAPAAEAPNPATSPTPTKKWPPAAAPAAEADKGAKKAAAEEKAAAEKVAADKAAAEKAATDKAAADKVAAGKTAADSVKPPSGTKHPRGSHAGPELAAALRAAAEGAAHPALTSLLTALKAKESAALLAPATFVEDADEFVELTMLARAKRFFHFYAQQPGESSSSMVMAAFVNGSWTETDRKCTFRFFAPASYLTPNAADDWFVELKSISSKGGTFGMFDGSDDQFGKLTGLPRKEEGIIAYAEGNDGAVHQVQAVLPKARRDGTVSRFVPTKPEETMAHHYRSGLMSDIMSLTGLVKTSDHEAAVELSYAEKTLSPEGVGVALPKVVVLQAFKRHEGEWRVRYRWPLSAFQACSLAISATHCPLSSVIDKLPPPTGLANATSDPDYAQLSAEYTEVIKLPGALCLQHEKAFVPFASGELQAGLMDVLVRVGLADGERQNAILRWAEARGVATLDQMLAALPDTQAAAWDGLLECLAPTKSYHKMRILTQLKRAAGHAAAESGSAQESFRGGPGSLAYWMQIPPAASKGRGPRSRPR